MRTDLKIGIIVGIVIVVGSIVYFTSGNAAEEKPTIPDIPAAQDEPKVEETADPVITPITVDTTQIPDTQKPVVVTPPAANPDEEKAEPDDSEFVIDLPGNTPEVDEPVEAAPVEEEEELGPQIHVVKKGENLYTISELYYGQGKFATVIFDANRDKITNPDILKEGWKLRIPRPEEIAN